MQTEAELHFPVGLVAHAVDALGDRGRRLAPHQVDVGLFGGDGLGFRRGASEVDRWRRVDRVVEAALLDVVVVAGEVERDAFERSSEYVDVLVRAGVARVVV
jgi:hypothetical protein